MACMNPLLSLSQLYYPITRNTVTFELKNFLNSVGADEQEIFCFVFLCNESEQM